MDSTCCVVQKAIKESFMKFIQTDIPEVVIIEPSVFGDERGYFMESFRYDIFSRHLQEISFIQDNESLSTHGVLRGLHYQLPPFAQNKLVRVACGQVLSVAADIRKGSASFGSHVAVALSGENKRQLYIPQGFAHGFVVLSQKAIFQYKVDQCYSPVHERGIAFDDPQLAIEWGLPKNELILSQKDAANPFLVDAELFS